MRRSLVSRIARLATLTALANGPDTINQRTTKLFQLHYFGLLARDYIVEFVQQLILVRQP